MPTDVALPAVRTVARAVALSVGTLVLVCAVATALYRSGADVPGSAALVGLALDGEFNLPTLVSVLLLAACAGLLAAWAPCAAHSALRTAGTGRRWRSSSPRSPRTRAFACTSV